MLGVSAPPAFRSSPLGGAITEFLSFKPDLDYSTDVATA
jgi:hypothetical protein